MQYYCLELTRALCCLSFLSGSSLSCKRIYHKQILPTARSSNSVKHCSEATQKKCRKICYLPTKHVLIWFLGRIQQPNRFHLPTISVLSKAEGSDPVRTRGAGQAEAHQCCPPAPHSEPSGWWRSCLISLQCHLPHACARGSIWREHEIQWEHCFQEGSRRPGKTNRTPRVLTLCPKKHGWRKMTWEQ